MCYLELTIKYEPDPVMVELDDPEDAMADPPAVLKGFYVDANGNRGERCQIERVRVRKARRVVEGETMSGRRVLVPV